MVKDPTEHHICFGVVIYHRIYITYGEHFVQSNVLLVSCRALLFLNTYFLHYALSPYGPYLLHGLTQNHSVLLWKHRHWMWWSNPKVSFFLLLAKRSGIVQVCSYIRATISWVPDTSVTYFVLHSLNQFTDETKQCMPVQINTGAKFCSTISFWYAV